MDVQVDGYQAHAATGSREINTAEPSVIFIHGAGMDRTVWQLQTRNVAHMGRRAYAVDLPAHGRSEGKAKPSIEAMADWIIAFMDATDIATATLVGHSMGSLIALEVAARNPGRMDRLCLMGVAETMPVHPDLLEAAKQNEMRANDLIVYWGVGNKAQIGGHLHPGLWVNGASRVLLNNAKGDVLYNDLSACDAYQGALDAAKRITCKTRFILGREDQMTPARKANTLIEAIDDADCVVIDHCGHMMMLERPNPVHAALKGFI